jgi:Uma2 family endonuclease
LHSGDKTDRAREVSPVYGLSSAKLTYADYCRLPSGQRYELIEGDISMTPSPNTVHQRLSRRIEMALIAWAESGGLGEVFHAPYDVVLSDNNVVQPDVLYVSRERRSIVTAANIQGAPDLVIEILSPNQEDWDRVVKRSVYARYGVPEYWLVNPTSLTVELLSRDEHDLRTLGVYGVHEVVRSVALPGLSLHVGTLFAGLEG